MAFDLFLQQLENQLNHNESVLWDCDWEKVSFSCVFFLIRWLKNWIGWSSVVGYKCAVSAFLFLLLLIVVAKHRHNYTWLVCFAGQIKLKLKTKVHNRQFFFLFTSFNQIWYYSENAIRSIAASKWTKEQTLPTAQQYIKSKCNSLSFFGVWLIKDGALLWFYSVFFSSITVWRMFRLTALNHWKKNWRKTNASNAVALNLFLSLCIFLQSNGSTHCVYSVMDNKRYILPVPTLFFFSLALKQQYITCWKVAALLFVSGIQCLHIFWNSNEVNTQRNYKFQNETEYISQNGGCYCYRKLSCVEKPP